MISTVEMRRVGEGEFSPAEPGPLVATGSAIGRAVGVVETAPPAWILAAGVAMVAALMVKK